MSRRPQSALPYSPTSPGGRSSPVGRTRMTYESPRSPSPGKRAMSGRAAFRADSPGAQPPAAKPPTAKKVRDEIARAAYAARSIAALEDAIARAPLVDRAKGEVGREFVDCGRLIVRLMQMKNDIKQHINRGDRSSLLHIKRLIQESMDISARSPLPKASTAEVLASFNYKKSVEAIGFCETDIEASESMAALDIRSADTALAKARKEGNEVTVERLEAFNQQKDVVAQRNAHLKLKVSAAGEETGNLRSDLMKAQQELQRVQGLLEQQDGLVGQCRAERDEARRMARQIEEDGELLLAEAQEETNAVRAELAKQAEKTKQLQQALSQKAKEVTELRRHIPTGDLLKVANRLADSSADEPQDGRLDSATLPGRKAVELNGLIQKSKREELLEAQVQRLTEKIEIYQRMYRIGIV